MVLRATPQPVLIKQGKLQLNLSFAQDGSLIRSKGIDIYNEYFFYICLGLFKKILFSQKAGKEI